MGAGVSAWPLARRVSELGHLGVVSGTGIDNILSRRLQDGDPGGHIRRALSHFPFKKAAARIVDEHFLEGGRPEGQPYRFVELHSRKSPKELVELVIAANFVEIWLSREGHGGMVGINYLEKIRLPHLPSIYGAMLAGVTHILMGAGIPNRIPGVLDSFSRHEPAEYKLNVQGEGGGDTLVRFDPRDYLEEELPPLERPKFLAIISSNTLGMMMKKRSNGVLDGFIVEGYTAGGHNAPPRERLGLSDSGEPVYGEKDEVDLEKLGKLGLPFWVAGGTGSPEKLQEALSQGAAGIQVGTAFALCDESGLRKDYRDRLLEKVRTGDTRVFTDPVASPTGFPFKVAELEGSLSDRDVYEKRGRVCDLGYLREFYWKEDGALGYRCPAEPLSVFLSKGGKEEETKGRKCICNALLANIDQAQLRPDGSLEKPLVTCGNDLKEAGRFLAPGETTYTAEQVISCLLAGAKVPEVS